MGQDRSESDDRPEEIVERIEWRLLRGHRTTDGTWKTDRQLRMQYIQLTDRLIHRLTAPPPFDAVVFLDKSARPVAWLLRALWARLSPMSLPGPPAPAPAVLFLNIDRMQWITTVDPSGAGRMEIDRIDSTIIRSLRSVFVEPRFKSGGLTDAVERAPTCLDGKRVLVVDEVYSSGRTIDIATRLLQTAIPAIVSVEGYHWMGGTTAVNGAIGNADLPVWYDESTEYGRGVGNRQVDGGLSRISMNTTQRLGQWFLSSRLPGPDPKSDRLRAEITRLAHTPDVPIRPDNGRDDVAQRLAVLNGCTTEEAMRRVRAVLAEQA